jgi:hypothetical protein
MVVPLFTEFAQVTLRLNDIFTHGFPFVISSVLCTLNNVIFRYLLILTCCPCTDGMHWTFLKLDGR